MATRMASTKDAQHLHFLLDARKHLAAGGALDKLDTKDRVPHTLSYGRIRSGGLGGAWQDDLVQVSGRFVHGASSAAEPIDRHPEGGRLQREVRRSYRNDEYRSMNMDCTLCGKYARYVAQDDGAGTLAGVTVKVSQGDPICLDCVTTLVMRTNKKKYVRVEDVEKIEPGKVSIGGRTPR